jgi:hypothetical protein
MAKIAKDFRRAKLSLAAGNRRSARALKGMHMDKKITGLVGAISALAPLAATAAPTLADVMAPRSYAELLQPIPNAPALLKEAMAAAPETPAEARIETAQYYGDDSYYHHHNNYYRQRRYRHHHHNNYGGWGGYGGGWGGYGGGGWGQRPYYHHHHHHHHHDYYYRPY